MNRWSWPAAMALAFSAACALPLAGAAQNRAAVRVNRGDADNGKKVTLPPGATLVVTLSANPTTGYSWAVKQSSGLKLIGKPRYLRPDPSIPGAGGHQVFEFTASGQPNSDATLQLQYARPFEKNKPPAKTYTLHVRLGG